jgi:hypothetical protein
MSDGLANPNPDTRSLLVRHQRRREQGWPTLSILVGPPELAQAAWRDWATNAGRRVLVSDADTEMEFAGQALREIGTTTDLIDAALAWIASSSANRFSLSRNRLARMTAWEFEEFWTAFAHAQNHGQVSSLVQRILKSSLLKTNVIAGLEADLAETPQRHRAIGLARLFEGLAGLVTFSRMPAIMISASHPDSFDRQPVGVSLLANLVTVEPSLCLALQIPSASYAMFGRRQSDARLFALLREGCVELESVATDRHQFGHREASSAIPVSTSQYLAKIGATSQATSFLAEAARELGRADAAGEDRARSAAERFLFEVLESLPATAGRFQLNARLEFVHGSRRAEGDLVAPAARVAIELDGGYYHLANADAYRRDRKKDYAYQRHGYLVLRFLSEDVVVRLAEIMDTIIEAMPRSGLES